MRKDWQYYEAHITIEPVFGEQLFNFQELCLDFGFQASDFLLKKRPQDTPERSQYDQFCTTRDQDLDSIQTRMASLISKLKVAGYKVWRYKIEDTLIDSRHELIDVL